MPPERPARLADFTGARIARSTIIVDAGGVRRPPRGNTRAPVRTERRAHDPARRRIDPACRLGQTERRLSGG